MYFIEHNIWGRLPINKFQTFETFNNNNNSNNKTIKGDLIWCRKWIKYEGVGKKVIRKEKCSCGWIIVVVL